MLTTNAFTVLRNKLIADLAIRYRLPSISTGDGFLKNGGLMRYSADMDVADQFRRAASYIDRIFKGEKPGDLPVQGPTKYELTINPLVPAYVLTLREFYPVRDAQWRVPTLLLFSGSGMAAGAWMGGALYDLFGYYGPAFFYAIAANVLNRIIVVTLLLRQRSHPRPSLRFA